VSPPLPQPYMINAEAKNKVDNFNSFIMLLRFNFGLVFYMYIHKTIFVQKSSFAGLILLALKFKLITENLNFNNN
jgi:hypothetical protein